MAAARRLLTWLVGALALVLAASLAVVDASLDEPFAVIAGVCVSLTLLLQSVRFRFTTDGLPLFAAGLAGLGALEGALAFRWVHDDGDPLRAALLAAATAAVLGAAGALLSDAARSR